MKMNRKVFTLVNGTRLTNIHSSYDCAGEKCVIHNPMRTYDKADLIWRNDRGIFEVVCEHGVGHVAPEQYDYLIRTRGEGALVHGCCWQRCCLDYYKEEA